MEKCKNDQACTVQVQQKFYPNLYWQCRQITKKMRKNKNDQKIDHRLKNDENDRGHPLLAIFLA